MHMQYIYIHTYTHTYIYIFIFKDTRCPVKSYLCKWPRVFSFEIAVHIESTSQWRCLRWLFATVSISWLGGLFFCLYTQDHLWYMNMEEAERWHEQRALSLLQVGTSRAFWASSAQYLKPMEGRATGVSLQTGFLLGHAAALSVVPNLKSLSIRSEMP